MSTRLNCTCGKSYQLKREVAAGKSIRCPACGNGMTVPAAVPAGVRDAEQDAFEAVTAAAAAEQAFGVPPEPYGEAPPPMPVAAPPPPPPPMRPQPVAWNHAPAAIAAPVPARGQSRRQPRVTFEDGWFGSVNGGVIGGVLMIVVAVVWFVVGMAAGTIFFYPPILFVIGAIAVIKGLTGAAD